jgi:cytochrome c oxidase subunit 2
MNLVAANAYETQLVMRITLTSDGYRDLPRGFLWIVARRTRSGADRIPAHATSNGDKGFSGQDRFNAEGRRNEASRRFILDMASVAVWRICLHVTEQLRHFRSGARGAQFYDAEGLRMRPIAMSLMSEEDVRAVARYVASLPMVTHDPSLGGDPLAGKKRYTLCSSCHGPDGSGNEAMQAPRIAGVDDWYLYMQLVKFKQGIRGVEPEDKQGQMMAPMAATLPSDKAMRDVVAYISTLKPGTAKQEASQ